MASSSGSSSVDSSHPHSLPGLSSREQIVDALLRACLGIDSNDRALFESAFAVDDPQVSIDVDGRLLQGMPAISKDCFDVVGPMDTHHMTAACRVHLQDAASTARLTATAQNQHFRAGQGKVAGAEHLLAGSHYDCEVIRDAGGQWKLRTWKIKVSWTQGTYAVMTPGPSK